MDRIKHILSNHNAEESYVIADTLFMVIRQSGMREEYSVKACPEGADSFWLDHPEPRFETLGGARSAILMYLES